MLWLLFLVLAGCLNSYSEDYIRANQTLSQYFHYLQNHSQDNYTLSWEYYYWKDSNLSKHYKVIVYNNKLIIQNFTDYEFWYFPNKTCYRVFDLVGCTDDNTGYKNLVNTHFWTKHFIDNERKFFEVLLKISTIYANNTSITFLYNYSNVSYNDLMVLGVSPSIVNLIERINVTYWFREDGMLKRIRKELYLTNNSIYVAEVNYTDPIFYQTIPTINNNTSYYRIIEALTLVMEPPRPDRELRAAAIEHRMPFLCKYDSNVSVCLDAYISKTNDIEACRYAPDPGACYDLYNASSRS